MRKRVERAFISKHTKLITEIDVEIKGKWSVAKLAKPFFVVAGRPYVLTMAIRRAGKNKGIEYTVRDVTAEEQKSVSQMVAKVMADA